MAHATLRFGVAAVLLAATHPLFAADPAPRVRLAYFPNLTHAAALVGVGRGTFQKALPHLPVVPQPGR